MNILRKIKQLKELKKNKELQKYKRSILDNLTDQHNNNKNKNIDEDMENGKLQVKNILKSCRKNKHVDNDKIRNTNTNTNNIYQVPKILLQNY
jgi:DNA-binding transcriptional regulator GbsR (MarR family)